MTTRFDNVLRSVVADAVAAEFSGGTIDIYDDSQPASAEDPSNGTLLATVDLPAPAFDSAVDGVASKAGSWTGVAVASGTASWFRMRDSGDTKHKDGAVTATDGGGEIELTDTAIVTGDTVIVNTAAITQPAE